MGGIPLGKHSTGSFCWLGSFWGLRRWTSMGVSPTILSIASRRRTCSYFLKSCFNENLFSTWTWHIYIRTCKKFPTFKVKFCLLRWQSSRTRSWSSWSGWTERLKQILECPGLSACCFWRASNETAACSRLRCDYLITRSWNFCISDVVSVCVWVCSIILVRQYAASTSLNTLGGIHLRMWMCPWDKCCGVKGLVEPDTWKN